MKRVLDVVRVQTVNWSWLLVWPLVILSAIFLLNLAISAVVGSSGDDVDQSPSALMSIYFVLAISHLQTITQVFPFAVGLSVTRRAFYAGTAVVVLAQSAVFGLLLTVMELAERATGGWGLDLTFFGLPFLVQENLLAQWAAYTVPFVALSSVGVFMGVVFKRWGQTGVFVTGLSTAVVAGAAVIVVTWQGWWSQVGSFFTDTPTLALLAGYPLVIAVVLGGAGWLALRRATP